ncbi:hypothetical protein BGW80DRAFT_922879 [Lactifluus volemus]|nr:hypothetical protein BGW80DRAFT_922879 [Lactifluus volemus]
MVACLSCSFRTKKTYAVALTGMFCDVLLSLCSAIVPVCFFDRYHWCDPGGSHRACSTLTFISQQKYNNHRCDCHKLWYTASLFCHVFSNWA